MCLIIATENPKQLHTMLLKTAYENNSDGFGVMFVNKGKLHTHKIAPKTFHDIEKLWSRYKDLDVPMGLHFRFNTNGDTAKSMSHPFEILSRAKGDDRDMWVMHNGPQLPTPMIDNNKSDTHQFVKWVLKPQLSANPKLLYNAEWQEMIEDLIGTDKLLFLDGKTKEFVIYNETEGKQVDNIGWLSNTYSIQPSSYGLRDKYYDFETETMKDVSNSIYDRWDYEDDYSGLGWSGAYNNRNVYRTTPNSQVNSQVKYITQKDGTVVEEEDVSEGFGNKQIRVRDSNMWNGKPISFDTDLAQLDKEELIELCEENPVGVGSYLNDLIVGNK